MQKYPGADLKDIKIGQMIEENHSLGNVNVKGVIEFNPYWFTAPPSMLQEAARGNREMPLGKGLGTMPYHGEMIEEPQHVVTHEFGHILCYKLPHWEKFATALLNQATDDPSLAPAGYALANPIEYFAELFACVELGFDCGLHADYMREFLDASF